MKNHIESLNNELEIYFSDSNKFIGKREDSRADGAQLEKKLLSYWPELCTKLGSKFGGIPGNRTIFDVSHSFKHNFFGIDIKTKNLDPGKYSDGGVCSVANLLKFLEKNDTIFVILEIGHIKAKTGNAKRQILYAKTAPIHVMPFELEDKKVIGIENLGTGQVRLKFKMNQIYDNLDWKRSKEEFIEYLVELAIGRYSVFGIQAENRVDLSKQYKRGNYENFPKKF